MNDEKQNFVFYRSFYDAAAQAPDPQAQRDILWYIVECCLGVKDAGDVPFPASAIVLPILQTVKKSSERYKTAVENGKLGGRPKSVWINRAEAELLYSDLKSWDKVADELGVSVRKLRRVRAAWRNADKTGQNLTDTDTVTDTVTVTDTDTVTSISNNKKAPTQSSAGLNGPPTVPDEKRYDRYEFPPMPELHLDGK